MDCEKCGVTLKKVAGSNLMFCPTCNMIYVEKEEEEEKDE